MTRTSTLFGVAAALLAAPALAESSTSSSTAACATGIHMIVARGSNEDPGVGRMGVISGNVSEQVAGSTVEAVDYPATLTDYTESEGVGAVAMAKMVSDYAKRCPDSKIALLGYSQGGQIAMDVVCGTSENLFDVTPDLSSTFEHNIVAVVTFGDPSHVVNATWDDGTSKNDGIFPRQNTTACEPYSDIIAGWCDSGDVYCDEGNNTKVHGTYFANYTDVAVDFIIGKFNASKEDGAAGSNETATATGSPTASSTTTTSTTGTPSTTSDKNGAESRQPSGAAMAGLVGLVVACVALF